MSDLKFGTDGWRAVIADQYTFANVERVARATAQWIQRNNGRNGARVVIGHDTRFGGPAFAERAAAVLASYDIPVLFASTFAPTPAISWATQEFGCSAGVVITASHNPPQYNGFKIKSHVGGPASPAQIAEVENELDRLDESVPVHAFPDLVEDGMIELRDMKGDYEAMIRRTIDIDAIRAAGLTVVHDAMFGAGQGVIRALLGDEHTVEVRCDQNPGFHGQAPEPIERNTAPMMEAVRRNGAAAGIANDGDADRVGMCDENGDFVDSHRILALLLKYLHEERLLTGSVVKTFSTTHLIDKMCERYGLDLEVTPIGFKYIGPKIVQGDVLIGGEESGGIAVKTHIPERDGIYIGLLVLEMMAERGMALSELVEELFGEFGPHVYHRVDLHLAHERKEAVLRRLDDDPLGVIDDHPVERVDTLDGYKHISSAGWLMVRPSGTEPVLRIYAEAPTAEQAKAFVDSTVKQFGLKGIDG